MSVSLCLSACSLSFSYRQKYKGLLCNPKMCIRDSYKRCEKTNEVPTLRTLRTILLEQKEREARGLALKLELFTEGNLNIFAQETNVERTSRITSFDIRRLQKQLKKIGLSVITDTMINRVNANWRAGRRTHLFYDEIHVIFENEAAANFLVKPWPPSPGEQSSPATPN